MFGFFAGEFGLGESSRLYASALERVGVAVALVDVVPGFQHVRRQVPEGATRKADHAVVDLIAVNPGYVEGGLSSLCSGDATQRFRIGCWHWELGRVPEAWRDDIDSVDAIMVSSGFVQRTFSEATEKPVFRVPLPFTEAVDSGLSRADFGLPPEAFIFLTSFDFHSSVHRKNPMDAIRAFRTAFPRGDENVKLVVKSSYGDLYPEQLANLIEVADGDSRVLFRDQVIEAAHMRSLQSCCDAYVSLHRAEGFGLGLVECMGKGKPVVATAWSGNMDFMDESNSCLVEASEVDVQPHEYPCHPGAKWAQPDVGQAAAWMRRLVTDAAFAARIGEQAAHDVRERLSLECVGAQLVAGIRGALLAAGRDPQVFPVAGLSP